MKKANVHGECLDLGPDDMPDMSSSMVPSIKQYCQANLDNLQTTVQWIGGQVVGGPDETGDLKARR